MQQTYWYEKIPVRVNISIRNRVCTTMVPAVSGLACRCGGDRLSDHPISLIKLKKVPYLPFGPLSESRLRLVNGHSKGRRHDNEDGSGYTFEIVHVMKIRRRPHHNGQGGERRSAVHELKGGLTSIEAHGDDLLFYRTARCSQSERNYLLGEFLAPDKKRSPKAVVMIAKVCAARKKK